MLVYDTLTGRGPQHLQRDMGYMLVYDTLTGRGPQHLQRDMGTCWCMIHLQGGGRSTYRETWVHVGV